MVKMAGLTGVPGLFFWLTILAVVISDSLADVQCEERADIVFVIDSSRSIRDSEPPDGITDNWQLVLDFAAEAINGLPVDNGEVRIGVLTYASDIDRDNRIHLDYHNNKADLLEKVRNLPYIGKNTNTAAALKYMHTSMFKDSHVRQGVRKVAILISDGISNMGHDDTIFAARDAKVNGDIVIFTLGITKYASVEELNSVASDPAAYYHFYSAQFEHLNLLLDQLLIRLCKPKPPAAGCTDLIADLTILLDSSGSIEDKSPTDDPTFYWNHLKNFANKIINSLQVSPDKTRVALVRFAAKSQVIFGLDTFTNARDAMNEVSNLEYRGGKTNASGAIRTMRKYVYQESKGDRPDVIDVGIIITDGESNVAKNQTEYEARRLDDAKIRVFGVGVTEKINRKELETIVSDPVEDHFFNTTRFEDIDTLVSRLVWRVCHEQCILEENETGKSRCTSRTEESACGEGESLHWRQFADRLLVGHNYARLDYVATPDECQRLCVEDSRCRSIDYVKLYQECAISYVTKEEDPKSFVREEGVDYYEWFCWDGTSNPDVPGRETNNGYITDVVTVNPGKVEGGGGESGGGTTTKTKRNGAGNIITSHWLFLVLTLLTSFKVTMC